MQLQKILVKKFQKSVAIIGWTTFFFVQILFKEARRASKLIKEKFNIREEEVSLIVNRLLFCSYCILCVDSL